MISFGSRKKSDHIIVVGCGRLGAILANKLSDDGKSVLIIDNDRESFRKLSPSFAGMTVVGDATEISVLQDADIEKATAILTVTNHDNTNIMISQLAKEYFNIGQVVARLYDPDCECVYQEFGIETICPAVLSSKEIDRILEAGEGGAI